MKYDIKTNSDLFSGSSLTIMIPEEDIDKKALYTIQKDRPDFILPFRLRRVDGKIEVVYLIEAHCRLKYIVGDCSMNEYAALWTSVLRPLLECGDWFMKPYSFVLDAQYLYYNKNKRNLSYVYIPTIQDCSDYGKLKEMAEELARQLSVIDTALENKVLRAIMKDFSPKDFLLTLKSYTSESSLPEVCIPPALPEPNPLAQPAEAMREITGGHAINCGKKTLPLHSEVPDAMGQGIIINIPEDAGSTKKQKARKKASAKNNAKNTKETKKKNDKTGLFSRKKATDLAVKQEFPLMQSSCDITPSDSQATALRSQCVHEPYTATTETALTNGDSSHAHALTPLHYPGQAAEYFSEADDATQYLSAGGNGGKLWLVGSILLPALIDVQIGENEVFTIGRYDAAVGRQQSSFEFERKTKAISRRHSAIERKMDRYSIIDLASSAGTFVNGQKLPPNTPHELSNGCRVSFGNSGADYVWEE